MPVRQFLQTCAPVVEREPAVFFEAVLATCTLQESGGRPMVLLRKPKVRGPGGMLTAKLLCFCTLSSSDVVLPERQGLSGSGMWEADALRLLSVA
jgi:hypothetical protein